MPRKANRINSCILSKDSQRTLLRLNNRRSRCRGIRQLRSSVIPLLPNTSSRGNLRFLSSLSTLPNPTTLSKHRPIPTKHNRYRLSNSQPSLMYRSSIR